MIKNQKNNQSIYNFENYYFKNNDFQFYKKALFVTARAVASWSEDYQAEILIPKKGFKDTKKHGFDTSPKYWTLAKKDNDGRIKRKKGGHYVKTITQKVC